MITAMASSTLLFFLSAVVMHLSLTAAAQLEYVHHNCSYNRGNYSANSGFAVNLKHTLSSLIANASTKQRFYNLSIGQSGEDRVYGLFQCRGDTVSTPGLCRSCIEASGKKIVSLCPNQKEAIIWYELCMLRYTNRSIFGIMEERPRITGWSMETIVVDKDQFNATCSSLMEGLISKAVSESGSSSSSMFATGDKALEFLGPGFRLYGLVQCTPDISHSDCNLCLQHAFGRLLVYFTNDTQIGRRTYTTNCQARYEWYRFYNDSMAAAVPGQTPSPPTSTNSPSGGVVRIRILVGSTVSALFVIVLLLGFCIWRKKRVEKEESKIRRTIQLLDLEGRRLADDNSNEYLHGETPVESQEFPLIQLDLIYVATKNFSNENKLGEGGFGPVYKGTLENGKEIAVKRLSRTSGQGLQEFKTEVTLIARLQHKNLVRLLGCCLEGEELLLIYEYMCNKSLDGFLFDSTKSAQLDWKNRLGIINGIARGLLYLHEDSRLKVIHRDLKASNVLLDHEMNPKISDFGMAKIFGGNQNEANTKRIVGTYGYMAPEYAMEGLFSIKSDVFSFGVLLLEIISGKKNGGFYLSQLGESLLTFAWKLWSEGRGMEVMDPLLVQSCMTINEVLKCIHIGLLCVQEDPADRPTMSSVAVMLATDTKTLPQPTQPAFSVGRAVVRSTQPIENKGVLCSLNEITLSGIAPR